MRGIIAIFLALFLSCLRWNDACAKEYQLSICSVFKDEAPYLKEWIEYHRLVGVDHFYLYNNESTDLFRDVLGPYIRSGVVTLIDWPDPFPSKLPENTPYKFVLETQVPGFEHAIRLSASQTEWLALLDVDEFMVPVKSNTMRDLLEKYRQHSCILLTWQIYGTSGVKVLPERTVLIEALNRTASPENEFNTSAVKSIVRPEMFASFHWPPHVCLVKDPGTSIFVPKDEARLNHYFNRTEDFFFSQKIKRKERTANKKLGENEVKTWFELGNEIEDQEKFIHKFVPELRKRMGFEAEELVEKRKILIYAPGHGSIFSKDPQSNRDQCNAHFHRWQEAAEELGYEMTLVDSLENLGEFEKLFVFEIDAEHIDRLDQYPKEKLVLFLWEPPSVKPENYQTEYHRYFSRVYTWRDDLVDQRFYFKFYYPLLQPMSDALVSFKDKKLCTMIACNKWSSHPDELYSERARAIQFFEQHHPGDFDLYGKWWDNSLKTYRGPIPNKADCMQSYRFAFAYENIKNIQGYVTEKIFDCFGAGCVPIYLGASNVADYIPKECFIARSDFGSDEELYAFLKSMSEEEHQKYLLNIRKFLESDQAKVFTPVHYIKIANSVLRE